MSAGKDFGGARRVSLEDLGVIALNEHVFHARGNDVYIIERPDGSGNSGVSALVLRPEVGDFRIKVLGTGDFEVATDFTASPPNADVTDGSGGVLIKQGETFIISAPRRLAVVGSAANAVLTYWFQ